MANVHPRRGERPVDVLVTAVAWLLCVAAGFAIVVAVVAWSALGPGDDRCLDERCTSFELVFQVALAAAGFATTLVMWRFVRCRRYAWAGVALAVALLLFSGWAVFLDAATHGWDDLKLLWLGATGPSQ